MTGGAWQREETRWPRTPELASTGTPVHTCNIQHPTSNPPPVQASHGRARPARAQGGRAIGRQGHCRFQKEKEQRRQIGRGRGRGGSLHEDTIGGSKDGPEGPPAACGRMTAARPRRARALGRRLKKGNVGMQDPGWRLGCQGGVPNRVVTWGGLGGSERRPIACWGLVEAKRQFERQSWSEIWNVLLCVPFARSGDRGSRIADGILRIRKDVSCTAQDHHPSSIIISELIALSCCRIISKRRGTG